MSKHARARALAAGCKARGAAYALMRVAALALACLCMLGVGGGQAFGASSAREPDPLAIECDAEMSLARVDIRALPASTDPASIETGVPCGMTEMCGLDPCLCGATDSWGACACNGRTDTFPTYSIEADVPGVVQLVEVFGTAYVVAVGSGSTDVVVTAELAHHESARAVMHVEVASFGVLDAVKLVCALAAVVLVCALVVLCVRAVVRRVRNAVARVRRRRAERREEARRGQEQARELAEQLKVARVRTGQEIAAEMREGRVASASAAARGAGAASGGSGDASASTAADGLGDTSASTSASASTAARGANEQGNSQGDEREQGEEL